MEYLINFLEPNGRLKLHRFMQITSLHIKAIAIGVHVGGRVGSNENFDTLLTYCNIIKNTRKENYLGSLKLHGID